MRERFAAAEGDFVTLLNVHEGFVRSGCSPRWCLAHGLDFQALSRIMEVKSQLRRLMQQHLGLPLGSSGRDVRAVVKAVASGFFLNAARLREDNVTGSAAADVADRLMGAVYKSIRTPQLRMRIHPSSVLFRASPKFVVYHSLVLTSPPYPYMREVSMVEADLLMEVAPSFFQQLGRA
eukprot:TRINITY_DN4604_c0_g2_i1.p1 TRINITY_DN4604_c0_g2~~TRINITY_DN4604_c0_g2_i1.p1  ORF type:complete len:178 (-),score=52.44 TRINITY_DN4604_c0_g2_i1:235-768(-)